MTNGPNITDERYEAAMAGDVTLTPQEAAAAYRRGHMTVSRAAELCNLRREAMEDVLIDGGVEPRYGPDEAPGPDPLMDVEAYMERSD